MLGSKAVCLSVWISQDRSFLFNWRPACSDWIVFIAEGSPFLKSNICKFFVLWTRPTTTESSKKWAASLLGQGQKHSRVGVVCFKSHRIKTSSHPIVYSPWLSQWMTCTLLPCLASTVSLVLRFDSRSSKYTLWPTGYVAGPASDGHRVAVWAISDIGVHLSVFVVVNADLQSWSPLTTCVALPVFDSPSEHRQTYETCFLASFQRTPGVWSYSLVGWIGDFDLQTLIANFLFIELTDEERSVVLD